jgi:RNA polymerase-binding transcription factor DksA
MTLATNLSGEAVRKRLVEQRRSAPGLSCSMSGAVEHRPQEDCEWVTDSEITAQIRAAEHRLAELDDALGRLETGAYGVCATCGEGISLDRLDALPSTGLCRQCA